MVAVGQVSMDNPTANEKSNVASALGRRISVVLDGGEHRSKKGIAIAFNPKTNKHRIQFDDREEKELILNCTQLKWIVHTDASADNQVGRAARRHIAVKRDVVGRKLKIYHTKRGEWFHGTILSYEKELDKHSVKLDSFTKPMKVDLCKRQFGWTDLIGPARAKHALSTSRYMGVYRSADNTWSAWKGQGDRRPHIGTFVSEKDAALAHDVSARRRGDPVNFKAERITEAEMKQSMTSQQDRLASIPIKGKSQYRGAHWQKNRENWMARYTLSHLGQKDINLGAFVEAKHAALAFGSEARKRNRSNTHLNFPDMHPTDADIKSWKMNGPDYSMMGSGHKKTSQYRGACLSNKKLHVQINIQKVVTGYG